MKPKMFFFALIFVILWSTPSFARKLSPEEKLVRRKCMSCHDLPKQAEYSEEELIEEIAKHGRKLRRLKPTDKEIIINYLKQIKAAHQ